MIAGHRPRKRFGQHFLVDADVVGRIVDVIAPGANDVLVEIGPGQGAITRALATRSRAMHAIELDRDLVAELRVRFAADSRVTIHQADALRFDFASLGRDLRIAGNLPYNISTPLLFHLLDYREHVRDMHFMLQKEVVDRITALPGSKAYGRLTIMLGCLLQSERLFEVGPQAFRPPPKVVSSVLRMQPHPAGHFDLRDARQLSKLVAQAFSKRRKTVRNALQGLLTEGELAASGIDPGARPEQIAISEWVTLSNLTAGTAA
jgi:16S rRNA (adenine1518-N6/adenine1519-N6)-dimethyltransferase